MVFMAEFVFDDQCVEVSRKTTPEKRCVLKTGGPSHFTGLLSLLHGLLYWRASLNSHTLWPNV